MLKKLNVFLMPFITLSITLNLSIISLFFLCFLGLEGTSLVAQMIKNMCAVQETQVHSLDQEDPLEKGMATHSSILAWRIPLGREA